MSHTDPPPGERHRAPAAVRLERRHTRTRRIRRRSIATAAAVFAMAWGAIFVQLVSGHDPALAKGTATVAATQTTKVTTSGSSTQSTAATTQAATPTQVVTHQS